MAEVAQDAHDDVRGYILGLKKDTPTQPEPDLFTRLDEYCRYLSQAFGFETVLKVPTHISADAISAAAETQLLYILREALSNACNHSGAKQAELTITLDGMDVLAVVEDHGQGILQEKRPGHFGLGIMRERAVSIGGSLQVDTAPSRGTRLTVRLPRQVEGAAAAGLRLLLVDDHPLFLEGLSNLVTGRGMQVVGTAADGLQALEQARTLHPDIILMDIDMPNCDGIEATRRIKSEMPAMKVVMLTVSGEERHLFEALQCGASGYLLKSLDAAELTGLLEELLRGEISLSPHLAERMLQAFTRHQLPHVDPPGAVPAAKGDQIAPVALTTRQEAVLKLVSQGYQYKEIALQLGLAEVTIKYHMGEIIARLHLHNRREAVEYFQAGSPSDGGK
jgi:DNA-binding NarL/FixJ family response regulator